MDSTVRMNAQLLNRTTSSKLSTEEREQNKICKGRMGGQRTRGRAWNKTGHGGQDSSTQGMQQGQKVSWKQRRQHEPLNPLLP